MTLLGYSLEEAVAKGRGTERPFRCPVHDDTHASATVNVVKGVWFCHACHAKGKVEGKSAPKIEDLLAMMDPERAARVYPQSYLQLFNGAGDKYWDTRLDPWVTWWLQMGQDPFCGDATFPVHTPAGSLAGVGRRHVDPDPEKGGKRYLYPPNWSASTSLGGLLGTWPQHDVVCLVEGYADAASVWETGCPALCTYGAGLHLPQVELVARLNPKVVLFGFDMDDRGEEAVTRGFTQLRGLAEMRRVHWPKGDPNETPLPARRRALAMAVAKTRYGDGVIPLWEEHTARGMAAYQRYLQGGT